MSRGRVLVARARELLLPVRAHLGMGIAALAAATFLQTLDPLIGRVIIDEALARRNPPLLFHLLTALVVIALLALLFESIGLFLATSSLEKVRIQLQAGIAARQLRAEKAPLSAGAYQHFTTGLVHNAAGFITMLPSNVSRSLTQLVWTAFILTALSPVVGGATLVATLGLVALSHRLSGRIAGANAGLIAAVGEVAARLQQLFSARRLLRQHHRETDGLSALNHAQERAHEQAARLFLWETAYHCQEMVWSQAFTVGVIAITGLAVVHGKLTLGQYIAISIYVARLQGPIHAMLGYYKEFNKNVRQFRDVTDCIAGEGPGDREPRAERAPEQVAAAWSGPIEARELAGAGLNGASLRIERGSRVLLAGEDAQALALLLELLAGARSPGAGSVTVGGHALAEMPQAYSRRWATFIAAEPQLLAASLRENICFGAAPEERALMAALEAAGLAEFVAAHGLDAAIDPAPSALAPEIRHGIQLARAVLLDPELWLVEDFTASVGHEFAARVFGVIGRCGRTVVAAGSRGDLLELAERVVWVEGGKCLEAEPIDAFLAGPRASRLVPRGQLQVALQGKGASAHAAHWAERHGVALETYWVELFGDERRAAAELGLVAEALRRTVRDADLVLLAGKTRLRCVFLGDAGGAGVDRDRVEERLVKCVDAVLRARRAENVYFSVDCEPGLARDGRRAA